MPQPVAQSNRRQLGLRPLECVRDTGQFQRRRNVFQCRHRRDKVEGLEHHPHIVPAHPRQRILVHCRQVMAERRDSAPRGGFEPAHKHKER